jgi:ADP-ribosylglycohydrolase
MEYPQIPKFAELTNMIVEYSRLMHEYGSEGVSGLLSEAEESLRSILKKIKVLPIDMEMAAKEPNELAEIKILRDEGPRKLWRHFDSHTYQEKLEGALLARMAGCVLGAVVELWDTKKMEDWAAYIGDIFPPVDYWSKIHNPNELGYQISPFYSYTREGLNGVPVDDDIIYTLLGLLIVEEFGANFTTMDAGKAWLKYLPYACTAEDAALSNLKAGVAAMKAAEINNPYCQWIGADIRSDPLAYIAPAFPEKAAEMAYSDAYLSHRRNGIYGEMFFSAAQSAAFAVDNAIDALRIGLTEIPKSCALYRDLTWALNIGKDIKNYKDARRAVDERFKGMSTIHTNNNACLTTFGLMIGGTDVTKVISETVAMGLDNDCTAATAGSIVGAIVGKIGVPGHWYKNFNNKIYSYLIGIEEFKIDDVINRFTIQAKKVYGV